MTKRLSLEEFIYKAEKVHGGKYNYANVQYVNARTKITVGCPIHGDFIIVPDKLFHGAECQKCAELSRIESRTLSQEEVITRFIAIHGNKFDYSRVVYTGRKHNVLIGCEKHGYFKQPPDRHLQGAGCRKCADSDNAKRILKSTDIVVSEFVAIHGLRYDYSKVNYVGANNPVKIICSKHGEFKQIPSVHKSGGGCPKCGDAEVSRKKTGTLEEVLAQFRAFHGSRYDYSLVEYVSGETEVKIICPEHGVFEQLPVVHKRSGCPKCGNYGFQPNDPAILYYLKINDGEAYKIGVTNRTIKDRFNSEELSRISVINTARYEIGRDAFVEEQRILKKYSDYLLSNVELLSGGNTELFIKDVLGLDDIK